MPAASSIRAFVLGRIDWLSYLKYRVAELIAIKPCDTGIHLLGTIETQASRSATICSIRGDQSLTPLSFRVFVHVADGTNEAKVTSFYVAVCDVLAILGQ